MGNNNNGGVTPPPPAVLGKGKVPPAPIAGATPKKPLQPIAATPSNPNAAALNAGNIGYQYLSSLLTNGELKRYYSDAIPPELMLGMELEMYQQVQEFVRLHSALPSKDWLESKFGLQLAQHTEASSYYAAELLSRHVHNHLRDILHSSAAALKDAKQDKLELVEKILLDLLGLKAVASKKRLIDFGSQGFTAVMRAYQDAITSYGMGISTGWPTLDKYTDGLKGGDILSIIGRPAAGKTFSLQYNAVHNWDAKGLDVLFGSTEINWLKLSQRFASMQQSIPLRHISTHQLTTSQMNKLKQAHEAFSDRPNKLTIFDSNMAATVDDLFSLVHVIEPAVLMIDGAYLLRHPNGKLDRYTRVAENMEAIKRRAEDNDIPVCCTFQFNKDAAKKKKNKEKVGLEDIAYSDVIGQVSSVVLGLTEPEEVGNMRTKMVEVLKGRDGQEGAFPINWDFDKMDFSEVAQDIQDLQFD